MQQDKKNNDNSPEILIIFTVLCFNISKVFVPKNNIKFQKKY